MKKVFLLFALFVSMTVSAQRVEKVGTVQLGLPYNEALSAIKAEFGEPVSVSSDEVIYGKKNFRGFNYDEVKFRFKNGRFNEARFFMKVGSKVALRSAWKTSPANWVRRKVSRATSRTTTPGSTKAVSHPWV